MTGKPNTPALNEFLRKARKQGRDVIIERVDIPAWETQLTQAISAALELRGFNDYGKYLDNTFLDHIRPIVNGAITIQLDNLIEDLDELLEKIHEGQESKEFKTGMFRGIELVKMLIDQNY